eukprot:SAG22_NODE_8531_length_648_cov_0.803279_1_plen_79_part_10
MLCSSSHRFPVCVFDRTAFGPVVGASEAVAAAANELRALVPGLAAALPEGVLAASESLAASPARLQQPRRQPPHPQRDR